MASVLNAIHRHCTPRGLWQYVTGIGNHRVRFLFGPQDERVGLLIDYSEPLHHLITQQLHAQYPTLALAAMQDAATLGPDPKKQEHVWSHELLLWPDLYPIQRHSEYKDETNRVFPEPLTPILEAVAPNTEHGIRAYIEITTTPVAWWRRWRAQRAVQRLSRPDLRHELELSRWYARGISSTFALFRFITWLKGLRRRSTPQGITNQDVTATSSQSHEREADTTAAHQKVTSNLFKTHLRLIVIAPTQAEQHAQAMVRRLEAVIATTVKAGLADFYSSHLKRTNHWPRPARGRGFLLSTEELATLFHPTTKSVSAAGVASSESRKPEPPQQLPLASLLPNIVRLGRIQYRERRDVFGIKPADRRRHIYVSGRTGTGKTTLLQNMIMDDIKVDRGVAVIDPHGDLADRIARSVPKKRWRDVVLFDPADSSYPIGVNPLECSNPKLRHLAASAVTGVVQKVYKIDPSNAPRLIDILRNTTLALMEVPGTTLLSLTRFLGNPQYREELLNRVRDPFVRDYWINEFGQWKTSDQMFAVASVQNKIRPFVIDPLIRSILGQPRNRLHLREIMDDGRILIVNLSKGKIGEDNSALLGSMIVSQLQMDAMSRADIAEEKRRDFFAYVDEFQNFATPSFETILSEARKYRLNLTVAHQYLGQLDGEHIRIRKAIFGNVGTMISFGLGYEDAQFVSGELREQVLPSDLVQLPKYHAYVSLMIDGHASDPFLMHTLKPEESFHSDENFQALRNMSRSRYATPASLVDEQLHDQLAVVHMLRV